MITGSHSNGNEEFCCLRYNTLQSSESQIWLSPDYVMLIPEDRAFHEINLWAHTACIVFCALSHSYARRMYIYIYI
jgi:hypothetical protein